MPADIRNRTKGTVLHKHPRWATTVWQQAFGLMFRRPVDECLIFSFARQRPVRMHMWFVFGSIDIIALHKGRVIALKQELRPWTLWNPGVSATVVVELPRGTIKRTRTAIGDRIILPS